ncbi:hypothetical protein K0T92_14500 [Paenibacillus oenotherae]|uniref:Phage-related protein n=1 Tax=Paenibacillus oenotherae TaxID=1435645 RepID=A0ABS7D7M6_9BACL|nr:hypothetical protein [Paenibacillus oenotherae]MBW7475953.1 hypothetical protein [Paenibacillus oenotherae]
MAVVRNLLIRAGADFSSMRREMTRAQADLNKFKAGINNTLRGIGAALAAVGVGMGLGSAIKDAMTYEASLQQINRMMQTSAGEFKRWSEESAIAFGIARSEAVKYGAVFSNLIGTFESDSAQLANHTKDILKTSAVISGATGRDMEDVMWRIRSGLLGNTEAIEDLGVNVNVAMLESTEAFKKFANGKSWLQLSFQTQQQIRLFGIMEQSAKKYGTEVAVNTASKLGTLVAILRNVKLSLGQAFLPIVNLVLPILTTLATALARVMSLVAQFSQALFGKKTEQQTSNVNNLATAYTNAGDAAKKAGKKAAQSVAGFDQLNVINKSSASGADDETPAASGAADIGLGEIGGGFADTAVEVSAEVQAMADKIKATLNGLRSSFGGFGQSLAQTFAGIGPALQPFVDMLTPIGKSVRSIGNTFIQLKDNFLVPFATYVLGDFIPSIVTGFVKSFAPVIAHQITWAFAMVDKTFKNATNTISSLWTSTWLPALELIKQAFITNMPLIAGSLDSLLTNTLNPFVDFFINQFVLPIASSAHETLVPIFTKTLVWAVGQFADTFENAVKTINGLWESTLLPALSQLRDAFLDAFPKIAGALDNLLDNTIKPLVEYILNDFVIPVADAIVRTLVPILSQTLVVAFREMATNFKWAVGIINDTYKTVLKPVFDLIKKIVLDTLQIVKNLWDEYGADILNGLTETMTSIRSLFQSLWDDILKPIIIPFLEMLTWLWDKHLKGLVTEIGNFVAKLITAAMDINNKFIAPIVGFLIKTFGPTFTNIFNLVSDVVGTAVGIISDVIKGLLRALGGVIDFIAGVFTLDWKRAWGGIQTWFEGFKDVLVGIFKGAVNLIIDAVNFMVRQLNKIDIKIPDWDWLPDGMQGKSFGINIPEIPKLAKGGLAYGPTLAMVGDNRGAAADPEVIAPLSKLSGIMGNDNSEVVSVLRAILSAVKQSGPGDQAVISKSDLARAAISGQNDLTRRAGHTLAIT